MCLYLCFSIVTFVMSSLFFCKKATVYNLWFCVHGLLQYVHVVIRFLTYAKRLNASFDLVENVLIVLNFHVFDFKLLIIRDTDFN